MKGQSGHEDSTEELQLSGPGQFGMAVGSVWGNCLYFWIILKLLLASDGCFEVILIHFQKTLIFVMDLNDFLILWGQVGGTLGSLGGYLGQLLGHFGVTLGI